ncbi:MAG: prephenate dehydrogenase [Vicinamibacterales bacterium]
MTLEPPFHRVGIVGLGLIGGSIALAVRAAWPDVTLVGVDRPEALAKADARGLLDRAGPGVDVLAGVDLVVLCAPVRQNLSILAQVEAAVPPTSVITDAGSTKLQISEAAGRLSAAGRFVGGHPLAGAAVAGLDHARADLFRGQPWILTPGGATDPRAVERLHAWVSALGAVPTVMSADEHDRLLAFVSHLPQLVASALMSVVGDAVGAEGLAFAGRGLVDTTRLASSPPEIWRDIAASNAERIAPALDAMIALLHELRADLASGVRLDDVFAEAARWRDQLVPRATL